MDTALATAAWRSFTQRYWGLEPVELAFAPRGANGPQIRALPYADRRGRLRHPENQPHVPIEFIPTPTTATYRLERSWLETARCLVDEMARRGIHGELTFSPGIADLRPWKWAHFRVTPRFTNYIDFPFTWDRADRVVRQQSNKAQRAGFTCERTEDARSVLDCLAGSQSRKGFAYGMSIEGLELAGKLLGSDVLRLYLCRAPDGRPATARVMLHRAGGRALDWMAGTTPAYLHSGATQMLLGYALQDLQAAGATGHNSCGADIEPVAHTKLLWGGRVVPQYTIQAYDLHALRKLAGGFVRYVRHRRALLRRPPQPEGGAEDAASPRGGARAPDGAPAAAQQPVLTSPAETK